MKNVYLDKVQKVDDKVLDGEYGGLRSGYTVEFTTLNGKYTGQSTQGVRGMNIPCIVVVKSGVFQILPVDNPEQ